MIFGTINVVRSSPWYLFLEADSTPGHMVPSVATEKSPATPLGTDPETLRLVAQYLNHYATPDPQKKIVLYTYLYLKIELLNRKESQTKYP
jgi:hypothetical protein